MLKNRGWTHALWAAPLTVAIAGPVMAQAPAAEPAVLDEIVVTARKREESLIEVPIAVTAVTAEQIAREGIRDVENIIQRDPSLNFDLGIAPYDTRIVIRGLSPTRGRPNVATLVDGIDVSSESSGVAGGSLLINPKLIDIAQIEIVKGPQSALYGRSAFSGAISYTTADPEDEVGGNVFVDFSDRNQTDFKASLSLPMTDTLGMRLSGYYFDDKGFYRNAETGSRVGGGDGQGGALTVKWAPGEVYALKFRAEYSDDEFDPAPQAALAFNATNAVPANASICNVGTAATAAGGTTAAPVGFVIDRNCPLDAARLALGLNAYRELDRLTGNRGIFDDMAIPAFNGSVGDAKDRGLTPAFNRDYTRSTDNGVTAPEFEGSDRQVTRLSAVQTIQTGFGSFASLTGYTRALVHVNFDIEKSNFRGIQQTLKTDTTTEQFSQELRFTSDFDGPINFFAGLQYWTERVDQIERNNTVIGSGTTCFAFDPPGPAPAIEAPPGMAGPITIPPGSCTNPTGGFTQVDVSQFMDDVARARTPSWVRRTVDHTSAYLDVEWKIVDSLKIIAEARYTDEDNFVSAGFTDGSNGPGTVTLCGSNGPCRNGAGVPAPGFPPILFPMGFSPAPTTRQLEYPTLNEKYWSPKGTIQWQPNEDLNIYASYAQARKPGGYSTVTIGGAGAPANGDDIRFESEKLDVAEIGAKWRALNGRLLVTGAIFQNDFTDKQVGTQVLVGNTITNRVTNAGKALIEGIELGAQFRLSERWLLGGGITYFSTYEYTDYKTTSTGAGEIARVGNCTIGYLGADGAFVALGASPIPVGRSLTCQIDRTGNFLEDTPELAAAINLGYRRPVGTGDTTLFFDVDANYQDERFLEDDNTAWLDSYWLANLRVGLETPKWSALLYVDNIADDRTVRSSGTGPAIYASDFRLGSFTYFPPGSPAPAQRLVPAPSIPTTTFADLPRPRTMGVRFNYKF